MTLIPSPYVIVPVSGDHRAVDLWSSVRLPFEPKGWVRQMRNDLRAAVSSLTVSEDEVLQASYVSTEDGVFDLENVLFYNVGPGCFARCALNGIRFERSHVRRMPGGTSPPLNHFHQYAPAPRDGGFLNWRAGPTVVDWEVSLSGEMTPGAVWLAIKSPDPGEDLMASVWPRYRVEVDEPLGLRLRLTVPRKARISVPLIVKPLIDGVVSAFHVHDGTDLDNISDRLAVLGLTREDAACLLMQERDAMLGARRLLWPWREGVQWNPADDRLVACELLVERKSRWWLEGELFSVSEVTGDSTTIGIGGKRHDRSREPGFPGLRGGRRRAVAGRASDPPEA